MLTLLLDIATIWFSLSIVVIATGWYASVTLPVYYPDWWRRVIVDVEPTGFYHQYKGR